MLNSTVTLYNLISLLSNMICIKPELSTFKSNFCADSSDLASLNVSLIYYNCSDNNSRTYYPLSAPENITKNFDENKPIVIYIFGWLQYPDHPNVQSMMNALCYGGEANVVLLDWSTYSKSINYLDVFSNSQKVGMLLGQSVSKLNSTCNVSNIYVVGFSLGAHIAGFAGECIKPLQISRITGLDPANPTLSSPTGRYLTSNDAKCVDVIHSDMCKFGTPPVSWMATTQVYVNGGCSFQPPNCTSFSISTLMNVADNVPPLIFCSHRKSVDVYIATKYDSNKYIATQCSFSTPVNSCIQKNECNGEQNSIGYYAENIPGLFYLDTHGQ